ncbi:ethanolamine utilization protein EutE [Shigella sonnei]|nr:ethanolamine utilization protein EutE [Shigella sonnei]
MRLMEGQHAVKLTAEQAQQLQPVLLKNIDERGKGTVSRGASPTWRMPLRWR